MALRSIELFAGGGGLALGLHSIGIESCVYVERDFFAASILAQAIEEGVFPPALVHSDVRTFDGRPWSGLVQVVAGGFPCQDVSIAGSGRGLAGERSGLWREFARIVGEVRPEYVFVENVAALRSRGLDSVLEDLAALRYDAEWGTFRASDVGAPHRRDRLFLLAHTTSVGEREPDHEARAQPREDPREDAGRGSRDVAYSKREGLERWGAAVPVAGATGADEAEGVQRQRGGDASECGCSLVADSEREGLRFVGTPYYQYGAFSHGHNPHRLYPSYPYPPGPGELAEWELFLRGYPGLEPSVRRGADGLAYRTDRLRVTGNGVVPAQAALAWRVLHERLMLDG